MAQPADALDHIIDRFEAQVVADSGEPELMEGMERMFARFRDKTVPFELRKAALKNVFAIFAVTGLPVREMGGRH